MEEKYFYDTYALLEIFKISPSYVKYSNIKVITTYFQLFELYYNLRKIYSHDEIAEYFDSIKTQCVSLSFSWIKEATEFRQKEKKRNLSYADCIGYIASKNLGVKFLTGDMQFKDMPNVEFVK